MEGASGLVHTALWEVAILDGVCITYLQNFRASAGNITSKLSCPILSLYTLPLSPHCLLHLAEFKKSPQGNPDTPHWMNNSEQF
jgi:hypothetical protein